MPLDKSPWPNHYGETCWRFAVPEDLAPGGLEVMIKATEDGLEIGDCAIPWAEIEEAKTTAINRAHEQ